MTLTPEHWAVLAATPTEETVSAGVIAQAAWRHHGLPAAINGGRAGVLLRHLTEAEYVERTHSSNKGNYLYRRIRDVPEPETPQKRPDVINLGGVSLAAPGEALTALREEMSV